MIYLLCMCLIISNFKLEINTLSTDLGVTQSQLQKLVKELGARIEKKTIDGKRMVFATLVLPLSFPTARGGN